MTLVEALIALLVLTVGAVGLAGVFLTGMSTASSGPNELIATQKAAEAIESVFGARDSHALAWNQIHNTNDGGVFLTGARSMTLAGDDGVLNTADDGAIESVTLPGPDQALGTGDDTVVSLASFSREIKIVDVTPDLRSVAVTIKYRAGSIPQTYTLTSYISRWT